MTDKKEQLIDDILDYFVISKHDHCVAWDHGLCCDEITSGNTECEDCWRRFFEEGRWWEEEYEPDPDRKWKEMREG